MDCLFCKIAQKEVDSKILYEDDEIIAFLDIDQEIAGHTLIIPKKHFTDYFELDQTTFQKMFQVAKKLQPTIMEKLDKKACTISLNYGDAQIIKHVHMHLLPHHFHEKSNLTIAEVYNKLKDE